MTQSTDYTLLIFDVIVPERERDRMDGWMDGWAFTMCRNLYFTIEMQVEIQLTFSDRIGSLLPVRASEMGASSISFVS